MQAVFFTSASGWVLVVLLIATIALAFLLRRNALTLALGLIDSHAKPFLRRLRLHYWLGYFIAGIAVAHAWVPMSAGFVRGVNTTGLYLATGALFLIFGQVFLGRSLRSALVAGGRKLLRRWHFWLMLSIVALVAGHIALNSPTLQGLFR